MKIILFNPQQLRAGIWCIILMFASLTYSNAQTLSGQIKTESGKPIAGVTIKIDEHQKGTSTDNDGKFTFENLSVGKVTLSLSMVGFVKEKFRITLIRGQNKDVEITMKELVTNLDEVVIEDRKNKIRVERLPDIHDTFITAGKKNEVIELAGVNGNISEKTGRQLFAKVPGVFVYDMDGSGNQVNISTRGLDPHRSWEYNIRQNGIITNSDMYGYPASHYSPAMEAIGQIEMIHGTSSLQYGAQFGGMINYVTKKPDTTKAFGFESVNSVGSYGLFSSYNAIGGKVGKLTYSAYYQRRYSEGYRKNAQSKAQSQFMSLTYEFTRNFNIKAELGRSAYVYHIPGPLTDAMFDADPRQSTRSRNYFNPDIYVPSIEINWKITPSTKLRFTNSGVYGARNSVMYDAFANVPDTINPATNDYKARQVDIDNFHSYTSELKLIHQYRILGRTSFLTAGVQFMNNDLHRRQLGKGTTGSDFDLTVPDGKFGRDLHLKTKNIAVFLENMIYITPRFTVSPGFRIEHGKTDMSGTISYYDPGELPTKIKHNFPLFGVNSQYRLSTTSKIYGGISQAYRPVVFKDIIPGSVLEKVDKNLKDAYGYNLEFGISAAGGKFFNYDISLFQILYNNRLGTLSMQDENNKTYLLRTNTGNSRTRGVEAFLEIIPFQFGEDPLKKTQISVFTSTSYFDAQYIKGSVIVGAENVSVVGNRLEGVPKWISRNGLQVVHRKFSGTLQYSYVSSNFSDALNTVTPSANGTKGKVPSYGIWDINTSIQLGQRYVLRMGVNNFLNNHYFTKRPTMYPGAGVWSSDGRSAMVSFGIKI